MRQPHARNWSGVISDVITKSVDVARIMPTGTPICGKAPKKPRRAGRRVLDGHERRATPLAAGREALQDAEQDQQDRRGDADRGVRRQEADERRWTGPSG